jgi:hypothetical protein
VHHVVGPGEKWRMGFGSWAIEIHPTGELPRQTAITLVLQRTAICAGTASYRNPGVFG